MREDVRIDDSRSNSSSFFETEFLCCFRRKTLSDRLSSSQDQSVLSGNASDLNEIVLDLRHRMITGHQSRDRRVMRAIERTYEFFQSDLSEKLIVPSFRSLDTGRYVRALASERAVGSCEIFGSSVGEPIGQIEEHAVLEERGRHVVLEPKHLRKELRVSMKRERERGRKREQRLTLGTSISSEMVFPT